MHPLLLAAAEASRKIHHKEGHHRPPVNHAVAPQHIDYIPGRLSMVNPMKVHLVWYGSAWTEKQKKSVADFVSGMGQSDIWNVAAKYYNTPVNRTERTYVTKQVTLGNQVVDLGSKGNILNTDPSNPLNDVPVIINKFIQSGELPSSSDDVYLLISDKNTLEGGACQGYCGYHSSVKSDEIFAGQPYPFQHTDFKYSWVGNMEACGPDFMVFYCGRRNDVISPTGDVGIDRMFSTIIHEVMEASSNPDVDNDETAWNDAEGNENADMCAYQYGPNAKFENGYYYNAEWNGQKYYIQSNYDPERQFCGPYYPQLVPKKECSALSRIFPFLPIGDDCCNSQYADCANGHIVRVSAGGLKINGTLEHYVNAILNNFPHVDQIGLGGNFLTGAIPRTICEHKKLELFDISKNPVAGKIPSCIGEIKSLKRLVISKTNITGSIPESIVKLPNFKQFLAVGTPISGALPKGFGGLNKLLHFEVTNSSLSGVFPNGLPAFNGESVAVQGQVTCDATGTKLCLPPNHVGPSCGLTQCA